MRLELFIVVAVFTFLLSGSGYAALGGNLYSVRKDAQALGGGITTVLFPHYSRHEISRNWLQLREFTGARGEVFALAWTGRRHPDLKTLLGDHFGDFQNAIGQARRLHRRGGAVIFDSGNFHLEVGGHMMSVYGIVWLKDRIPEGTDLREIR